MLLHGEDYRLLLMIAEALFLPAHCLNTAPDF
jgi:hypothetical protein